MLRKYWLFIVAAVLSVALLLLRFCCWPWQTDTAGPAFLRGQVVDEHGPLAGAVVRFVGSAESTTSDEDGRFSLSEPPRHANLISAWKPGYFIAGAAADAEAIRIELARHATADYEDYCWLAPGPDPSSKWNCANCHQEIYEEWLHSAHARSASNRYFLNLYDGSDWHGSPGTGWNLMAEYPHGVGVCTACHAPALPLGDPAYEDLRLARGTAAQGTHCDFCHKVADTRSGAWGVTHGRFGLRLLRPREGQLFFGPLDDVVGSDAYAPVYRQSRYCATCHEGIMFGVHVYSTYSEWQESPAARRGQTCQACHMTPTGRLCNMAPGHGGIDRDPATLASHCEPAERSEMLPRCLKVATQVEPRSDAVRVCVTVSINDVGHWMPTGFIDRQLILVVDGRDAGGKAVELRSGPVLPDIVGSLGGSPGRLYAKQPRGFDGRTPVPFWLAQGDMPDTRLRPDRPDRAEFVFAPAAQRVRVRLLYRRFWEETTKAKEWPSTEITVVDQTFDRSGARMKDER